ncbi:alpha-1 2-mannosidase (plasmid) [Fulvitalea axinellae]|uniref:Alpha-1 2-mannosidase n=1 Tax=Fulvitalea axinellae TaxID=1182444 RepID=A0AAU9DE24_9BACT|nr:alpha-1 2-mannosidase [Fulvitalea axinellae]
MKKSTLGLFGLLLFLCVTGAWAQKPVDYVNPMIGTTNYGATHPGAQLPRGMISVSPFNVEGSQNKIEKDAGWNSRGYIYENSFLTGFTHVNLSGVGCPDLGTVMLMPTTGKVSPHPDDYGTTYKNEVSKAGYYSVDLNKYGVKAEMTASRRSSVSRYTFPEGKSNILLNLGLGLTNEQDGMLKVVSPTEIEGFRMVGTFCYNNSKAIYPVYFVMKFSRPADELGAWKESRLNTTSEGNWMGYNGKIRMLPNYRRHVAGDSIGAYMTYNTKANDQVEVKVGISYVSIENARENLAKEIGNKSFETVQREAQAVWNEQLDRIHVEGGTEDDKTVFYTALYHSLIHPNILNDINGEYPEIATGEIGQTKPGKNRYTVFSLWDTYRNLHQLMSLVYPEQQADMVQSMLDMFDENGWLPKWELNSQETFTMVGAPASPVIADTYLRGIRDFDTEKAMHAMLKDANTIEGNPIRPAIDDYTEYGYIPTERDGKDKKGKVWGSVSTSLEYYAADYSIAQMAKELGDMATYKTFMKRAMGYKKLYDKETGMLRPRHRNGKFLTPFDPLAGANFTKNIGYVEGNAYQYQFMVAHDPKGLMRLMGGKRNFVKNLETVFDKEQFDMANEPDIAYPFLFNYAKGEEWRTQKHTRDLLQKHFTNTPEGLPGNDDTGTMSAWAVFSMIGIYPDCPGNMNYAVTAPVFDKVTIKLNPKYYKGKTIVIETENNSLENYIEGITVNGKRNGYFVNHDKLTEGAEMKIKMKSKSAL